MLQAGITTIHVQSADGKCGSAPLTHQLCARVRLGDWEQALQQRRLGPPRRTAPARRRKPARGRWAWSVRRARTATGRPPRAASTPTSRTPPSRPGGSATPNLLNIILHGTFPDSAKEFDCVHRRLSGVAELPPVDGHHDRPAEGDHRLSPVADAEAAAGRPQLRGPPGRRDDDRGDGPRRGRGRPRRGGHRVGGEGSLEDVVERDRPRAASKRAPTAAPRPPPTPVSMPRTTGPRPMGAKAETAPPSDGPRLKRATCACNSCALSVSAAVLPRLDPRPAPTRASGAVRARARSATASRARSAPTTRPASRPRPTTASTRCSRPRSIFPRSTRRRRARACGSSTSRAFHDVALTARGGGTGTNGQSLTSGVVMDLSRHMAKIVAARSRGRMGHRAARRGARRPERGSSSRTGSSSRPTSRRRTAPPSAGWSRPTRAAKGRASTARPAST